MKASRQRITKSRLPIVTENFPAVVRRVLKINQSNFAYVTLYDDFSRVADSSVLSRWTKIAMKGLDDRL